MKVAFAEAGVRVVVAAADGELAEAVDALFPVLSVDAHPAAGWDFRVERRTAGFSLGDQRGSWAEYATLPDLLGDLEFRILGRLLAALDGWVHLHASGALGGAGGDPRRRSLGSREVLAGFGVGP